MFLLNFVPRLFRPRSGRRPKSDQASSLRRTRTRLQVEPLEDRTAPSVDLGFAFQVGSSGDDVSWGTATDAAGNAYVMGTFRGTVDFDPGPGVINLTSGGGSDTFVAKYSTLGELVWARAISGPNEIHGNQIAVDSAGNVYAAGNFTGTADFDPGPSTLNLTSAGGADAFLVKLDAAGNFVWARRFGGSQGDHSNGLGTDALGNVYLTGNFRGTVDFDPGAGTFNLTSAGGEDAFVVKLDNNGDFAWAARMGGPSNDGMDQVKVDANANVYLIGTFQGTADFDPGPGVVSRTSVGGFDVFLAKLEASGSLQWVHAFGSSGRDVAAGLALDAIGNVYLLGTFEGTVDFDPGPGSLPLTSAGGEDVVIAKFDPSGNLAWARRIGGPGQESAQGIAVDGQGNVYAGGSFAATADFDPGPSTFELTSAGDQDVFVLKLDNSGEFVWAVSVGGTGNDQPGGGITLGPSEEVYVSGWFVNTVDFDPGSGVLELTSNGSFDAFVWKLTQTPDVIDVQIDIKPGSDSNPINLASQGMIPIALFGSSTFDVTMVDIASIEFAGASVAHFSWEDLNGDGHLDLVLHFRTQDTNLSDQYAQLLAEADTNTDGQLDDGVSTRQTANVSLTGGLADGTRFVGSDAVDLFFSGKALRDFLDELASLGMI